MTVMPIMMVMMMIINEIIVQFIIYELTSEEAQRHNGSLWYRTEGETYDCYKHCKIKEISKKDPPHLCLPFWV